MSVLPLRCQLGDLRRGSPSGSYEVMRYGYGLIEEVAEMPKSDWVAPVGRVDKPWGWEIHFALVEGKYCGKVLHVEKGHALSLQFHQVKDETISIQSGRLLFEVGTQGRPLEQFELGPGESVRIVPGTVHRMTAIEDTDVLEASTTELDDVVRLDDRYGRGADSTD